ncbi:MAG: D-hexose-6-phosphate mutarotase, partial [Hydrogenovibrio sp.]|nr:D-hexose-6-phosphate mutarotase [Hydrogenovibrio sp.]
MPDSLAKQFNAEGVQFSMQQNLLVIEVENRFATAKITNHGASVLSYVPKQGPSAETDLLWVSDQAVFDGSKPVRGGIPVCWPWFGKAEDPELPAHGFVRNRVWQVEQVSNLENGVTEVVLSTHSDDASLAIWPHAFDLTLRVEIGEKLTMTLISHNPNAYDISITEAFHSYFNVA